MKRSPREPTAPVPQQNEQHRRFTETARALECDEDKERFEQKLKQIAAVKPKTGNDKAKTTRKPRGKRL